MKALVYDRYGSPDELHLRDVDEPRPGAGEVLVRVRAAALNPKDLFVLQGRYRLLSGWRFPKVVGLDLAGDVVAAGRGAGAHRPGERVFGFLTGFSARRGTVAELVAAPAHGLAAMPRRASYEEAAGVALAGSTALQALRDVAGVRPGDRVLVHGASGGVGTLAIQLARSLGGAVTATSGPASLARCRELGAEEALEHASGEALAPGRAYRVVFDVFGNLSLDRVRPALGPGGVFVTTVPSRRIVVDAARTALGAVRARLVVVRPRAADLEALARLVDEGGLRPQTDRVFPLGEAADAVRYLRARRAHGKIVVRVG